MKELVVERNQMVGKVIGTASPLEETQNRYLTTWEARSNQYRISIKLPEKAPTGRFL